LLQVDRQRIQDAFVRVGKQAQVKTVLPGFTLQRPRFQRIERKWFAAHTSGQVGLAANEAELLCGWQINEPQELLSVIHPGRVSARAVEDEQHLRGRLVDLDHGCACWRGRVRARRLGGSGRPLRNAPPPAIIKASPARQTFKPRPPC